MKTLYFVVGGTVSAVAAGFAIWKNRAYLKTNVPLFGKKVKTRARSSYGRVKDAASEVFHTETPQPSQTS